MPYLGIFFQLPSERKKKSTTADNKTPSFLPDQDFLTPPYIPVVGSEYLQACLVLSMGACDATRRW
jgi:hypothetical protein